MFKAISNAIGSVFSYDTTGYDAVNPKNKRRNSNDTVKSPDQLLTDQDRRRMTESGRDLWRNFATASWAIRKHLDYVASFNFHPRTGNERLDADLSVAMQEWSRRGNCEVMGKHSLRQAIRIFETLSILDGDVFVMKLKTGKVQGIEGDRIRNFYDPVMMLDNGLRKVHGITIAGDGRPLAYSLWNKNIDSSYTYARELPAQNIYHLGYFDGIDQIRGVSPLASAIAPFHDILEVTEYARMKAKVSQLFAITIKRDAPDYAEQYDSPGYDLKNFGKGPILLDLDPGDTADFLESKTPSTEFQQYVKMSMEIALKALDLDWSMFDSSNANYSSSRIALLQYKKSCKAKQERLVDLLNHLTMWKMDQWVRDGTITLPRGWRSNRISWDWIPDGIPWFDPQKELAADVLSVESGLRTRSEIRRERFGDDWYKVASELAKENEFMETIGLSTAPQAAQMNEEPEEDTEDNEDETEQDNEEQQNNDNED